MSHRSATARNSGHTCAQMCWQVDPPNNPEQLIIYANFCSVPTRQSRDSGLFMKFEPHAWGMSTRPAESSSISYFQSNSSDKNVLEQGLCFKESVVDYTHVMTRIGCTVMISLIVVTPKQTDDAGYLSRRNTTVDLNALGLLRVLLNSNCLNASLRFNASFVCARPIGGGQLVWRRIIGGVESREHPDPIYNIPSLILHADGAMKGSVGPFVTIMVKPSSLERLNIDRSLTDNLFTQQLDRREFFKLTGGTDPPSNYTHNLRLDLRIGTDVRVRLDDESKVRALGLDPGTVWCILKVSERPTGPDHGPRHVRMMVASARKFSNIRSLIWIQRQIGTSILTWPKCICQRALPFQPQMMTTTTNSDDDDDDDDDEPLMMQCCEGRTAWTPRKLAQGG